ncbi:MAG TPA: VOC family protein [Magnetospirillaceae bacterium]|jgi:catechol 2,3-dioxygenase
MASNAQSHTQPAHTQPDGANRLGVHSLDHFAISVPNLEEARGFYTLFGLDVVADQAGLGLRTRGDERDWGRIAEGKAKRLDHLAFGCYPQDYRAIRRNIEAAGGTLIDAPQDANGEGLWFRDPFGVLVQLLVAPKRTPDVKTPGVYHSQLAMERGAVYRGETPPIRPRRLSHVLLYCPDVPRAADFYARALGLRLTDSSGDGIAFMHAVHGSDHHVVAFAKSNAPGYHHSSWDVPGIEDIGRGAMQMFEAGYTRGWGLGRHVLGSNYFHYVRDPWGSFAEYSADIDYVSADRIWDTREHPPDNSFYLWGPAVPEDFVNNTEA